MAVFGSGLLRPPRIRRKTYFLQFVLPAFLTVLAVTIVAPPLSFDLYFLTAMLLLLPGWVFFGVGRCHDFGRSGWFLLVFFVPMIGPFWVNLELCLHRGAAGSNRFGPNPADL